MNASRIGQWVRRAGRNGPWHRVESEIAEAAITGCGRRMEPTAQRGAPLDYQASPAYGLCLQCALLGASR